MLNVRKLQQEIQSEVLFDPVSRSIYSFDASLYELTPAAIILPRSADDIQKSLLFAKKNNLSITPRGAGTNTAGSCLGYGLILDCSRHLNRIVQFDMANKRITVQPGITLDDINHFLEPYQLQIGPDVSTSDRATIGGMLACNAAGMRSLQYGSMREAVRSIRMVSADGQIIDSRTTTCFDILKNNYTHQHKEAIQRLFPRFGRISSGYYLPAVLENRLERLIAGSEGTLGIVTEIELDLVQKPTDSYLYLISFESLEQAFKSIPKLLQLRPTALELLDEKIVELARTREPAIFKTVSPIFLFESDRQLKLDGFELIHDQKRAWAIRAEALGLLLKSSHKKPIGFIEDMAVAPERLGEFYDELQQIFKKHETRFGLYGHVGAGCLHIRPFLDPTTDRQSIDDIANSALLLVKKYHGVFSSEHGDGLVRSWANPQLFGDELFNAMRDLKEHFDPNYRLNPGKIIPLPLSDGINSTKNPSHAIFTNLRNATISLPFTPFFEGFRFGRFERIVDGCNGNGKCRKDQGLMCPSFQVTGDERDSTRGRVNALRALATGALSPQDLKGDELYKVFDLCIACKGCSKECPASIDVSKLKAEYLFQRGKQTLRDRLLASPGAFMRIGSFLPQWFTRSFGWIVAQLTGITHIPTLANERFSTWAAQRGLMKTASPNVALFIDTFTEFLDPKVGQKAIKVLESLGLKVLVLPWSCCGRPKISKGYLPAAKQALLLLKKQFEEVPCPILTLEPSCQSVFLDEGPFMGLSFPKVFSIQEFLSPYVDKIAELSTPKNTTYLFHGHCHEKSLSSIKETVGILSRLPGVSLKSISDGCCGMAGSFGYEIEHEEISNSLFKKELREALSQDNESIVIANGISCRQQIKRRADRDARHFIEILADRMEL